MNDPRLDKLADVLVRYSASVKKGDLVSVSAEPASLPAVEAVFKAVLRAGGNPSYRPRSDSLREILLRHGSDEQIRHQCPFEMHRSANCDVFIVLRQPINTRFLSGIDPAKAAMAQSARRQDLSTGFKRMATGAVRYTLSEIPGNAAAQEAEMSLSEYSDWVYRAGFLHLDDPVKAWREQHVQQARLIDYLKTRNVLRFQSPAKAGVHGGTDLTVDGGIKREGELKGRGN